jgi:hypothetical protein
MKETLPLCRSANRADRACSLSQPMACKEMLMEKRHAAVLAADVAGYSALMD